MIFLFRLLVFDDVVSSQSVISNRNRHLLGKKNEPEGNKHVTVMLKQNVRLTVNVYQQVLYTQQKSRQVTAKKRRSTLE
jgi:hypothetical protein